MTDQMEDAARAFDSAMGRAPARAASKQETQLNGPEPIFENLGEHLDTSLDKAGGDDEPVRKPKKAKEPVQEEEDEDEDVVEPVGDEDEDDEGADDADDEENEGDEEDDDEEGEDDPEADAELSKEFTVMVDGVEKTVKLKEALNGYIRQETFHQRLNQLNEVKQTIIAEGQTVLQERQSAQAKLKEAEDILTEMMPEEPDWDKEFATDGVRANALRKQYDAFKNKVTEIKEKRLQTEKEMQEATIRDTTTFAQNEFPKFVKLAGWKGRDDQVRDIKSMNKTGLALGFSQQELNAVYDSRLLHALLKASKYDRMMAARPKAVPKKNGKTQQIPLGAGRNVSRTAPKGVNAAQARLSKTGSVEDAAQVFDQLLSQSRKRRNR
jgi:hypothetical protein